MAFFHYNNNYSRKDLYDWVVTELAVAKQMNLGSFSTFLDTVQKLLNQKNVEEGKPVWIPSLPQQDNVKSIKRRMAIFSKKVLTQSVMMRCQAPPQM